METAEAAIGYGPHLVAREVERRSLDRLLAGAARLVVVVGEAGVGKTTLVDDAAQRFGSHGVLVLRGRPHATRPSQLDLWRRPAQRMGILLPEHDPSITPTQQVSELVGLLRDELLSRAPVLVVLDDLHAAGPESLDVLSQLADELADDIAGAGVTLLCATRDEDSPHHTPVLRRAATIRLAPLSLAQTASLAEAVAGAPLLAEEVAALHGRTSGIPLLVVETLRNGTTLGRAAADVLGATLARAGSDPLGVLSTLALGGADLPLPVLAHACDAGVEQVQHVVDAALTAEVLVAHEGRRRFRHDLLAEAAADTLDPNARRATHAALAAAWHRAGDVVEHARHLVRALPTRATVAEVVDACEQAAEHLRTARRSSDAVAMLSQASSGCLAAGADPNARGRLALALGNARWDTGDIPGAITAFTEGASLPVDDLTLAARLEVARHRWSLPVQPDPSGRARLLELDEQLGRDPTTLRAELLGRLAALAQKPPYAPALAELASAEAVEVARAVGDPATVVQALLDRFLWVMTPERLVERDGFADEVVALSRRADRPELARFGLTWRLEAELSRGDVAAATRTADESSVLAEVSHLPEWQVASLSLQARLAALAGDLRRTTDAVRRIEQDARAAAPALPDLVAIGWVTMAHATRGRHFQLVDHELGRLHDGHRWLVDQYPDNCLLQVHAASIEVIAGRPDDALERARRWLADPHRFVESPIPLTTLTELAFIATSLGRKPDAARIRDQLRPFAGRIVVVEHLDSVDLLLAQLGVLIGDHEGAVADAERALATARSLHSPTLEAASLATLAAAYEGRGDPETADPLRERAERIASQVGMALEPQWRGIPAEVQAGATTGSTSVFRREADRWHLVHEGKALELKATRGLDQLARLLSQPGREVAATTLAGYDTADAPPVPRGLGPALDTRAKQAYRRRLLALQADLDSADRLADVERSARAHAEYDALVRELRVATGLGGRDRPQQDGHEQARVNVTRSLRRAINAIGAQAPDLGRHLQVSVRTGHWCVYAPDPTTPVRWEVRG